MYVALRARLGTVEYEESGPIESAEHLPARYGQTSRSLPASGWCERIYSADSTRSQAPGQSLSSPATALWVAPRSANSLSMNLRHAVELALVGWYLIQPPFSRWSGASRSESSY